MKSEIIVSSEDIIGGSPRLFGRRIDVKHVIWGITEYDDGNIDTYLKDFEVSIEEVRHAILYCKDEICELQNVPQSCNGCSKIFKKDKKAWIEYANQRKNFSEINTDNEKISKIGKDNYFLGTINEYKEIFGGEDVWKKAQKLYDELKIKLDLPLTYEKLVESSNDSSR